MPDTAEIVRFTIDPSHRQKFLTARPAAIAALKDRCDGLLNATLIELDDNSWLDVVLWETREQATRAAAIFPEIPQATAWATYITNVQEMAHGQLADR